MAVYRDLNHADILNDLIDIDSIKKSVQNIVFTERGTVMGFPEFGCTVQHTLFEQMSVFTISTMKSTIENALLKWEPRIYNIDVNIIQFPEFGRIMCDIGFTVKQINTQENITLKLK
jgi:phage baseplate assembly protein W